MAMITSMRENMERNELREGPIAIAVDIDKTSCQALKWAVEQYIPRGETVKLVHVKQKSAVSSANGPNTDDASIERQNSNNKRSTQFLPMRCLCMRRNIQTEVVLLEDQDVAKALIEFISQNFISTFLLGASLKKSITRLFKVEDIPSNVMRWAPDFCTVLVISKGRLASVRSATRPIPQALPSPSGTAPLSPRSNDEAPSEMSLSREDDIYFDDFSSLDPDTTLNISSGRMSTDSSILSFYEKLGAQTMLEIPPRFSAFDDEKSKLSSYLNSPSDEKNSTLASPITPNDDADAEKIRLKKELKETMNMYHSTCQEALTAKEKVAELEIWKKKEELRVKKELKETMNMYHSACQEALTAKEKVAELEIWKKEAELRLQKAEETATMAIMEMEKTKLEVQRRVEKGRGNDGRKMVSSSHGDSHIVVKYKSLLHILVVFFVLYFYLTFSF